MPSAYFKTEGLIIKKMPFAEADFLVRMLTKDFGKIDVLAKSARKFSSKLNAHLDILNHVRIQFVKPASTSASLSGNGERMPTLTDAEIIARHDDWFLDADKLSTMGRVLQTLNMLILPGSSDAKLFSMSLDFFSKLREEAVAVKFLQQVFKHEGHGNSLPPEHEQAIIKLWPALKN